jgi:hypothetical protein
MDCIITKEEMFDIIKNNFTDELYKWMKIQFSDVCSNGDVCINRLLDNMNSIYNIKNENEILYDEDIDYIDYIYDAYINNYLEGKSPTPW